MAEYVSTVTQKGQVNIPGELRRALGLKPRDKVAFELLHGKVVLYPVQSPVLATYSGLKSKRRPEDFRRMRCDMEEEVASGVSFDRMNVISRVEPGE